MYFEEGVGMMRTCEGGCLHADEVALDGLAQTDGGFAGDVLVEQMLLHGLERLGEVLLGERLSAHNVPKVPPNRAQARPNQTAGGCCCGFVLLRVLFLNDSVHLFVEVLQHKLALVRLASPCVLVDFLKLLRLCCALANVRLRVVQDHVAVLLLCAQLAPCPVLLGALPLALCRCFVSGGCWRGASGRLLPVSPRQLCASRSRLPRQDAATWCVRPRGVWCLHWGRVCARVEEKPLRRLLQGDWRGALLGAVVVDAGVGGGDLDARGARVALALKLLHLAVKVGPELVAIDNAAVLRLQLLAVQAHKQRAHIVEQLVDPCQVHQALVDGDEDEAQVFRLRPLDCVSFPLVCGPRPALVGLWQCALLDEDVAD